ncbi:MAG: Asp-tRNA(Asn)/Glu-tRNA(Gln) amidotransferase subunit GatA [Campylobacterales bacterium]
MVKLREALKMSLGELKELKEEIRRKAVETRKLGGYLEQLTGEELAEKGEGAPIAIKDNINVEGWEITCCSKILKGYRAPYNATVIEKLLAQNLSPFGRTNMDEFAMGSSTETSCYGVTRNPFDPTRVPGGSSGGSAAVVGAGLAVAALGSDTGGSIRQPAAFCGVVGMKPTYGRVSRYGLVAFSSSLDQIGPITQDVEDAVLLYNIIAGPDPKDSTSAPIDFKPVQLAQAGSRKFKIGVIANYLEKSSPEIRDRIWEVVEELKREGHQVEEVELMRGEVDVATYYILATAEASSNLARFDGMRYGHRIEGRGLKETYKLTRAQFGEEVKRRILLGTFVLSSGYYDAYYLKGQQARHLIKEEYRKLFKKYHLLLGPVTPTLPFELGSKKDPLEMYLNDIFTIGVNLAGLPAISIPVGKSEGGLPIGVQLIGNYFDEETLFNGAYTLEALLR